MHRDESFEETLHLGRAKERWLAHWLGIEGNWVLPATDFDRNGRGAPVLHGPQGESNAVMPDFLAFHKGVETWWECKWKFEPTYHVNSGTWQHGIGVRSVERYQKIQCETSHHVVVAFLTESSRDIRAASLDRLAEIEHHRDLSSAMERGGMVFWLYHDIPKVGDLLPPPGESRALPKRYHNEVSTNDRPAPGPAPRVEQRTSCKDCGTKGQWQNIHAPNFIGPRGWCVPCFRRRYWEAYASGDWQAYWQASDAGEGSDHGEDCTCAICFDIRYRRIWK